MLGPRVFSKLPYRIPKMLSWGELKGKGEGAGREKPLSPISVFAMTPTPQVDTLT